MVASINAVCKTYNWNLTPHLGSLYINRVLQGGSWYYGSYLYILIIYIYMLLTHWGRVAHICVSKQIIMVSDNGLSPDRRQAIIWTNAGLLLIGLLGTNLSEILIKILTFSFYRTMHTSYDKNKSHRYRDIFANNIFISIQTCVSKNDVRHATLPQRHLLNDSTFHSGYINTRLPIKA